MHSSNDNNNNTDALNGKSSEEPMHLSTHQQCIRLTRDRRVEVGIAFHSVSRGQAHSGSRSTGVRVVVPSTSGPVGGQLLQDWDQRLWTILCGAYMQARIQS
jgi:hypothetical protein